MSGPCTRATRLDLRERVAAALDGLQEEHREALVLRVLEARPLTEVADRMERSESAVRRLVAAGLESLGRSLRREGSNG